MPPKLKFSPEPCSAEFRHEPLATLHRGNDFDLRGAALRQALPGVRMKLDVHECSTVLRDDATAKHRQMASNTPSESRPRSSARKRSTV